MEFKDIKESEASSQFSTFKNLALNMNSLLFFSSNLNSMVTQPRLDIYKSDLSNNKALHSVKDLRETFLNNQIKRDSVYESWIAGTDSIYCNYLPNIENKPNKGLSYLDRYRNRWGQNDEIMSDIVENSSSCDEEFKYRKCLGYDTNESNELSESLEIDKDIYDNFTEITKTKKSQTELNNQNKKRPKSTYPFGKCKVCNDKATGIHYGIATCEGCKGFFKRCTLKKEKYRCFFGNECIITPKNRNRCKSCRYQKCLEVNMSIQGAKMGRIPKAIKEQALKNFYGDKEDEDEIEQENTSKENILETGTYKCLENINYQKNNSIEPDDYSNDTSTFLANVYFKPFGNSQPSTLKITNNSEINESCRGFSPISECPSNNYNSGDETSFDSTRFELSNLKITEGIGRKNRNENHQIFSSIFAETSSKIIKNFDYESYRNSSGNGCKFSKSSLISLESKYFTTYKLFNIKTPLKTANIIEKYIKNPSGLDFNIGDSFHVILSLLGDKAYQLHIEYNEEVNILQERALNILYDGTSLYNGHNSNFKNVSAGFYESIPYLYKSVIAFARDIPSLNDLSDEDFNVIVTNKAFEYYILRNAPLFINNECFIMLPNRIQLTRKWMLQIIGEEMTNGLFSFCQKLNTLRLNTKELALLFPYVLTKFNYDFIFDDPAAIRNINESYYNALLYELDLNKRTSTYEVAIRKLTVELKDFLESKK